MVTGFVVARSFYRGLTVNSLSVDPKIIVPPIMFTLGTLTEIKRQPTDLCVPPGSAFFQTKPSGDMHHLTNLTVIMCAFTPRLISIAIRDA